MSTAATVTQGAVSAGGSIATALAPASVVPFIGPIVAGVGVALALIFSRRGPQQRIAATRIVDELEPLLAQNRDGYLAGPRTVESQQVALQNFDQAWSYLVQACGDPSLGDPGEKCVTDRSRGGRWDWFALYRDPIAADMPADPLAAIGRSADLLLPAALIAALVVL